MGSMIDYRDVEIQKTGKKKEGDVGYIAHTKRGATYTFIRMKNTPERMFVVNTVNNTVVKFRGFHIFTDDKGFRGVA